MTGLLKSKKSANRNYHIVFADFVNARIESANKLFFALFADFSKSVKLPPLSLKKKRGLSGKSTTQAHAQYPRAQSIIFQCFVIEEISSNIPG